MRKFPDSAGFTLIETMVVVFVFGILSVIAVAHYQKTTEYSRADAAKSIVTQMGNGNRYYYSLERSYVTGTIDASSALVPSFIPAQDWSSDPYQYQGADNASTPCLVAVASRKTGASPGTNTAPYSGWRFCFDVTGQLLSLGQTSACGAVCR